MSTNGALRRSFRAGPEPGFRGLPGEGVIVYQIHDDLQETYFKGGPLDTGQTYENAAEGFSVNVIQAIEGENDGARDHLS